MYRLALIAAAGLGATMLTPMTADAATHRGHGMAAHHGHHAIARHGHARIVHRGWRHHRRIVFIHGRRVIVPIYADACPVGPYWASPYDCDDYSYGYYGPSYNVWYGGRLHRRHAWNGHGRWERGPRVAAPARVDTGPGRSYDRTRGQAFSTNGGQLTGRAFGPGPRGGNAFISRGPGNPGVGGGGAVSHEVTGTIGRGPGGGGPSFGGGGGGRGARSFGGGGGGGRGGARGGGGGGGMAGGGGMGGGGGGGHGGHR